jgi:hypothetical protein
MSLEVSTVIAADVDARGMREVGVWRRSQRVVT